MSHPDRKASLAAQPQLTTLEGRQLLTTTSLIRAPFVVTLPTAVHSASATTPVHYSVAEGIASTSRSSIPGLAALGRSTALPRPTVIVGSASASRLPFIVPKLQVVKAVAPASTTPIVHPTIVKVAEASTAISRPALPIAQHYSVTTVSPTASGIAAKTV